MPEREGRGGGGSADAVVDGAPPLPSLSHACTHVNTRTYARAHTPLKVQTNAKNEKGGGRSGGALWMAPH